MDRPKSPWIRWLLVFYPECFLYHRCLCLPSCWFFHLFGWFLASFSPLK